MSPVTQTAFSKLSELCEKVVSTTKRLEKMALVGELLTKLPLEEVEAAALLIIGQPFPRASHRVLSLSWSGLFNVLKELYKPSTDEISSLFRESGDLGEVVRRLYQKTGRVAQTTLFTSPLTIIEVFQTFTAIADALGTGSRRKKIAFLRSLFMRATPLEAKYLTKILLGDQRIGFSEGMLEGTIARIFKLSLPLVQRANMLTGDIGKVTRIAREEGEIGLQKVRLRSFTPLLPMLAAQAKDVSEALLHHNGESAFEMKLDGARVQIHLKRNGQPKIKVYSRRLSDVTTSLPDVVTLILEEVTEPSCILEGEVIAVGVDSRPLPFQHLMRRFRRVRDVERLVKEIPVSLFLFDLLMLNEEVLIDHPYTERRQRLSTVCGSIPLVPQIITTDFQEAEAFFASTIQKGHEGLIAKRTDSLYKPGIRGKAWLKIKESLETLDLVIIAAEYGTGRRHRWLSDYHLGAWNPETAEFMMLGKTFKGLTDAEFEEITTRLLEIQVGKRRNVVFVQPKIVVEVEYDEIQRSVRYPSGKALRFARIKQIRYDKSPEEADTIQRVNEIFEAQFIRKASTNVVGRTPPT